MTLLELVRRAAAESGLGDSTNPTSLTGLLGEELKVKNWVIFAAAEIARRRAGAWLWQYKTGTLPLLAGTREYTAASASVTDLYKWDPDSFTIYKDSLGQSYETKLPYKEFFRQWRPLYEKGDALTDQNDPVRFTITPDRKLRFNPVPGDAYTVRFAYWCVDPALADDADVPAMPERFHDIIYWRAAELYCKEAEAHDRMLTSRQEYMRLLVDLESDQLETLTIQGGPLA